MHLKLNIRCLEITIAALIILLLVISAAAQITHIKVMDAAVLKLQLQVDTLNEKVLEGIALSEENTKLLILKDELELQTAELMAQLTELKRKVSSFQSGRVAYLTFDDGPSHNTVAILDILKEYGVRATFFVCGNSSAFGRSMYQRIVAEGHAIGNHTYTHNYAQIYSSVDAFMADVYRLQDLLEDTIGFSPQILRFPGGSNNHVHRQYGGVGLMHEIIQRVAEEGFQYFDWNVSGADATPHPQDPDVIIRSVLSGAQNKTSAIILLHDSHNRTTTVEALPSIIEGLLRMDFRFEVLTVDTVPVRFPI